MLCTNSCGAIAYRDIFFNTKSKRQSNVIFKSIYNKNGNDESSSTVAGGGGGVGGDNGGGGEKGGKGDGGRCTSLRRVIYTGSASCFESSSLCVNTNGAI